MPLINDRIQLDQEEPNPDVFVRNPNEFKTPIPNKYAQEQAFYGSTFSPDEDVPFNETYARTKFDLDTTGESEKVSDSEALWSVEQQDQNKQAVSSVITDANIPIEQRMKALQAYNAGLLESVNLKDKWKQTVAAKDVQETVADHNMQDKMAEAFHTNDAKAQQLQDVFNNFGASLDGSNVDAFGGILRDFLPGVFAISAGQISREALKFQGVEGAKLNLRTMVDTVFAGNANKSVADIYDNILNPDDRIEFVKRLVEKSKEIPGFDYNRFQQLNDTLIDPATDWRYASFQNVVSMFDMVGLGKFIRHPVEWFENLVKFKPSDKEKAFFGKFTGKPQASPFERIDPTLAAKASQEAVNVTNLPTGRDNPLQGQVVDETKTLPRPALESAEGKAVREAKQVNGVPPEKIIPTERDLIDAEVLMEGTAPRVAPESPAGIAATHNPTMARQMGTQGMADETFAEAVGTNRGEIIGDWVLPKVEDTFGRVNPDLAKDIGQLDKRMNELFDQTKFDPFIVPISQREQDKVALFRSFQETIQGAHYQQANSTFNESLGKIEGKATFGRNPDYGFATIDDAKFAEEKIKQSFPDFSTNVVNKNNQFYVQMDWSKQYDPFSSRYFGPDATKSSFLGFDTTWITRNVLGKHIFPATMRLPEFVTKGAFLTSVRASKVEHEFLKTIKNDIRGTNHPKELQDALEFTQENQKWMSRGELSTRYPNLSNSELNNLERSYIITKRLTDYEYQWANRYDRSLKEAAGHKAIYNADGELVRYGTTNFNRSEIAPNAVIWDFDSSSAIKISDDLQGKQLVRLETPVEQGNALYRYGLVGGKSKLDVLPHNTLARIEGYMPRKNIEHYYVTKAPKEMILDGRKTNDAHEIRRHATKTIGAAETEKDAIQLAKRLQEEHGEDFVVSYKQERGDIGDAIITDYKVYKEMMDFGNRRGERLPTINGNSRLEDPLVQLTKSIRTIARLDAWKDYDTVFKKNFVKSYGHFLSNHEFPNVLTDLKIVPAATKRDLEDFKNAQRLFEQYTNQKYKINVGDQVWKEFFHKIGDVLEDTPFAGFRDTVRDIANKGNLGLKSFKSLANTFFLYLNPIRQWLVQPQQILEYSVVEPAFRKHATAIPSILLGVLSKASDVKPYEIVMAKIAQKISGLDKTEYDSIVKALYNSGLPQSVDMNMMLHGGLDDLASKVDESMGRKAVSFASNAVNLPGQIGKSIGYSPAQMSADIASWLFAKARWERMNPGKNWNLPENIAQITADGWDIAGSMSTRAGAFPYQDGMVSLFFQFQAIQHKQFMQVFSSKTLKKAPGELVNPKAKLAAARTMLYGMYGTVGGGMIDWWVKEHGSIDQQADWNKWKGGIVDWFTNKSIDIMMDKEGSDLALSDSLSPMPEFVPYWDFIKEASKMFDNSASTNPRFPSFGAFGSMMEAGRDFKSIFSVKDPDTEEAFTMLLREAAEMTSGWKNWEKAMMIQEMGDKKDKFGNKMGLNLDFVDSIAQMFGVITREELAGYRMQETKLAREDFIKTRAQAIHEQLIKFKNKIGDPDYLEWRRRTNVMLSGVPAEIRDAIEDQVISMDKISYDTKKESVLFYIRDHAKHENDKFLVEMVGHLRASDNPADQEFLRRLRTHNIIKD